MKRSRINSKFKKKSQKTLILSILGIILLLILIIKFGIPFIVTVGNLLERVPQSNNQSKTTSEFIAIPIIEDLPNATNKKKITLGGISSPRTAIELFVSGELYDETQSEDDGSFSFEIYLSDGDNIIKARAKKDKSLSEFSSSQTVKYINSPPSLTVESPAEGSTTNSENLTVSGKTDEGVSVTINGFWAVLGPDNSFSYNLKISQGENKINIIATDEAGNKTEKELNVTYSP